MYVLLAACLSLVACGDDAPSVSTVNNDANNTNNTNNSNNSNNASNNATTCTVGTDCDSGVCDTASGECLDATCDDGVKNAAETDFDCGGGTCGPCVTGATCVADGDCETNICTDGTCAEPSATCDDAVQNQDETDVDCGGDTCNACADGQACSVGSDCASTLCEIGICEAIPPSCADSTQNQDETDVDCGGATCDPCGVAASCSIASDCDSGVCTGGSCVAGSCGDGVENGNESDVDCGGSCSPCADGGSCAAAGDCDSGVCTGGSCIAASCTDGVQNQDETAADCGGATCGACADGEMCAVAADCASQVCDSTAYTCVPASCADGVMNGDESAADCGGTVCAGCATGIACGAGIDCLSGVCDSATNLCLDATCTDSVQNQDETDVDCGGATCADCADGALCLTGADCVSGVCDSSGHCAVPACDDAVLNGDETDVDCGGATCSACTTGAACAADGDCATGLCSGNVCLEQPSCKAIAAAGVSVGDGTYTIDPDGAGGIAAFDVHCDMTSDQGAGYTMLRIDDANLVTGTNVQSDYRAACNALGLELIVPRTRAHARSIVAYNGDEAPNVVGVYPQYDGAVGIYNWEGECEGTRGCSFFMTNTNSVGCTGFEPNGDNNVSGAIYRRSDAGSCLFGNWNDGHTRMDIGGYAVCSTNDAAPPIYKSCLEIMQNDSVENAGPNGIDGVYTIDPDGTGPVAPLDVYCDMTTDGGGYTYLKVDAGAVKTAPEAEAICAASGMQLFIPRSETHRNAALAIARDANIGPGAGDGYMYIMGIYPNADGATCVNQPLTSANPNCLWHAGDDGGYWVHNRSNIGEPNGDNTTTGSMGYLWTAAGEISWHNDLAGGYSSQYFMCDVGDKQTKERSCNDILSANANAADGVHTLGPMLSGELVEASCDMTTDGGGWTLVLNYLHAGGTNPALLVRNASLPLLGSMTIGEDGSLTQGNWGHAGNAMMRKMPFEETMWYGKTSFHDRVIHFKNDSATVKDYLRRGVGSAAGVFEATATTNLPLYSSATLPLFTNGENSAYIDKGDLAMTEFPFYSNSDIPGNPRAHWGIKGLGSRWEVDDYPGLQGSSASGESTYHQVWIR